jgi:hypothetical protein
MPTTGLRALLLPGERVLWQGMPGQGFRLEASDLLTIPFSILWCGFAVFWEGLAVSYDAPLLFRLWGIPFVLIGLYMLVGRFFYDIRVRARTTYAVTDRRVLILKRWPFQRLTALALGGLDTINLEETGDGAGTIHFGDRVSGIQFGENVQRRQPPRFIDIRDVRRVFNLIQESRQGMA